MNSKQKKFDDHETLREAGGKITTRPIAGIVEDNCSPPEPQIKFHHAKRMGNMLVSPGGDSDSCESMSSSAESSESVPEMIVAKILEQHERHLNGDYSDYSSSEEKRHVHQEKKDNKRVNRRKLAQEARMQK